MPSKKKNTSKRQHSAARRAGTTARRRPASPRRAVKKRRPRKTPEAIKAILSEATTRGCNADVIRKHKLSATTFYSWKRKYGTKRRKRAR